MVFYRTQSRHTPIIMANYTAWCLVPSRQFPFFPSPLFALIEILVKGNQRSNSSFILSPLPIILNGVIYFSKFYLIDRFCIFDRNFTEFQAKINDDEIDIKIYIFSWKFAVVPTATYMDFLVHFTWRRLGRQCFFNGEKRAWDARKLRSF